MELLSNEKINEILSLGEDSFFQFKLNITDAKQLAEEMVAFLNAKGGHILIGIDDKTNTIVGLEIGDISRINQLISSVSSENVFPNYHPITENRIIGDKRIIIIYVEEGFQKPYNTKTGKYLIKSGSDKRVLQTPEIQRIIFESAQKHIEEIPIIKSNINEDLQRSLFYFYFEKEFNNSVEQFLIEQNTSFEKLLNNLYLAENQQLTLLGLLFFSKNPQQFKPMFCIDAIAFYGNDIADNDYITKEKIEGTLDVQYSVALSFLKNNLRKVQIDNNFNSNGKLEIAETALQEAIVNALVHRNYGINSTIKIFVFENRVEIISPGKLYNSLSIEKIMLGTPIARNPLIVKFGIDLLPYSGLGSGIRRILKNHPQTELINDTERELFIVRFSRK